MQDKDNDSWQNLQIYKGTYNRYMICIIHKFQIFRKTNVQIVTINLSFNIFYHLYRLMHSCIEDKGEIYNNYSRNKHLYKKSSL